jgi:hypothetical protein
MQVRIVQTNIPLLPELPIYIALCLPLLSFVVCEIKLPPERYIILKDEVLLIKEINKQGRNPQTGRLLNSTDFARGRLAKSK